MPHVAVKASTDVEKKAALAVRWYERAMFADEPLVSLLFLFFGLEALVGDNQGGSKAHRLAFRKALLNVAARDTFSLPTSTYLLYNDVRSTAVHGGIAPEIDRSTVDVLALEVRTTLGEFLTYAADHKIAKRSALLRHLEGREEVEELENWLRQYGGPTWEDYSHRLADEISDAS